MKTYLVGGAVRDKLLNLPVKDKDWVVVGGSPLKVDVPDDQIGAPDVLQRWPRPRCTVGSILATYPQSEPDSIARFHKLGRNWPRAAIRKV